MLTVAAIMKFSMCSLPRKKSNQPPPVQLWITWLFSLDQNTSVLLMELIQFTGLIWGSQIIVAMTYQLEVSVINSVLWESKVKMGTLYIFIID